MATTRLAETTGGLAQKNAKATCVKKTTSLTARFHEYATDPEIDNLRIGDIRALLYPQLLLEEIPCTLSAKETVTVARREISDALHGRDDRIVAVVGPCSIHDPKAALDYAAKLRGLQEKLKDDLLIVMRVYFEKPRTISGWKGLINDPHMDMSFDINTGLRTARQLLADINNMGLPAGCEYLDTIMPQYTADLTAWAAIGARTTECQLHRELASGLSMPVGFKNGTSGNVQMAVDACRAAAVRHAFLSITKHGVPAIIRSLGNDDAHVILRGGTSGVNYGSEHVRGVHEKLRAAGDFGKVMVDCSHGNSLKDPEKQSIALRDICAQVAGGEQAIGGIMLESHIYKGAQSLPKDEELHAMRKARETEGASAATSVLSKLKYGVSITDGCIDFEETERLLVELAEAVQKRRKVAAPQSSTTASSADGSPC